MINCAVIVAGGSGRRMGASLPKQFLKLGDKTILEHCLERFVQSGLFHSIVVVLPLSHHGYWHEICSHKKGGTNLPHILCAGGDTRSESVKNGLDILKDLYPGGNVIVAIHDAVRPFIHTSFLKKCLDTAWTVGNAIPCLRPVESFRYLDNMDECPGNQNHTQTVDNHFQYTPSHSIDRERIRSIQTPQCFHLDEILAAFTHLEGTPPSTFTDEASLLEKAGGNIHLCEGLEYNIKITRPFDMELGNFFLSKGY